MRQKKKEVRYDRITSLIIHQHYRKPPSVRFFVEIFCRSPFDAISVISRVKREQREIARCNLETTCRFQLNCIMPA
jgi:hypothetical protein